jgi:hypothetical protein
MSRLLLAALLLLTTGCRKTDAQRAAEERAQIRKRVDSSFALVPWRGLKTILRSRGAQPPPAQLAELVALLEKTRDPPPEAREAASVYLHLAVALYQARATLKDQDEDKFPVLWTTITPLPTPGPWYDAPVEHLLTAYVLQTLELADRSERTHMPELVFYELSRAEPSPGWPWVARAGARLERGIAFCQAEYHYAAEEELTAFLDEWERIPPADLALFAVSMRLAPDEVREIGRATGHFLRGWNRLGLGRDKQADEDLTAALRSLEKIGVDDELTQWTWAFLHYRAGRYAEAGNALRKLSESPYLDARTRVEIREAADKLAGTKNIPVLSRARAAGLIVRALVARAGGLEKVLIALLGEEQGKKAWQTVAWLERLQHEVAGVDEAKLIEGVGSVKDKGKELGGKGLQLLKEKVGQ